MIREEKRRETTKFYKTVCESKSHPNNPFPLWCRQNNSYHPILSPFSNPLIQQKDKSNLLNIQSLRHDSHTVTFNSRKSKLD